MKLSILKIPYQICVKNCYMNENTHIFTDQ